MMSRITHTSLFIILICGILAGCDNAVSQEKQIVKVPMRDGIRLVTEIWFPEGEGPWPAILVRTPYVKNNLAGYGKGLYHCYSENLP